MKGNIYDCFHTTYLDSHNPFPFHQAHWLHVLPHNVLGSQSHQVHSQRLGHKGEGARNSDIALDHFELVILRKKNTAVNDCSDQC